MAPEAGGFSHRSVMPEAAVRFWATRPDGVYVDATAGAGGHARALLERLPAVRLVAVDQDPAAVAATRTALEPFAERVVAIVRGNFRRLADIVVSLGIQAVDGVLMDLGVSSGQLDWAERGFSYQHDAPLDMRMDPDAELTAFRLVNSKSEAELTQAFREWGEERWAGRIAAFIVRARRREPIRTTGQLVEIIKAAIPASARRAGGHPARRVFQALRIWVNDELGALDEGLESARRILGPEGHLVVISFHSLEDRMVKQRFRRWQEEGAGVVLTRRAVTPDTAEQQDNPRARSAKLRAFARGG